MPITARTECILREIKRGRKYRDIAKEYGISIQRVGHIAAIAGLPRRTMLVTRSIERPRYWERKPWWKRRDRSKG